MNSLLSWLSEAIGGGNGPTGGTPMMPGPGGQIGPYGPGGDPMQDGGMKPGGLPYPTGGDPMTAGGVPPNGPGLPPTPPQNMNFSSRRITEKGPPLPPIPGPGNGANGIGPGLGVATPADIGAGPSARGILGRALGLDPNQENNLRGSLAAGLKSVGENWHKPGLAAASGSAGAALEGGKGADDKTFDQQGKVVDRATRARAEDTKAKSYGVTDQLNRARTELVNEQTKMAKSGGGVGVMNSQQQLYLRANALVNSDQGVRAARTNYENALKLGDPNSPEVKAAKDAFDKSMEAARAARYAEIGLDPKIAEKIGKQPGFSKENPMPSKGMTQQQLNALPPGTWVVGPDGKALQKKAPAAAAAGPNQPAAPMSPTPQVQPAIPPAARNARAEMEADDEED